MGTRAAVLKSEVKAKFFLQILQNGGPWLGLLIWKYVRNIISSAFLTSYSRLRAFSNSRLDTYVHAAAVLFRWQEADAVTDPTQPQKN